MTSNLRGFGKRLKNAVKTSPYTQKQLSEILSINQDTFSNYVKEVYYPKADMLHHLCNLLDISPDWLLTGQGAPRYRSNPGLAETQLEKLAEYEQELIYHYRLLSEREQGRVDQFILSLLEAKDDEQNPA